MPVMKQVEKYIWQATECIQDGGDIYPVGFYFQNEAEMLDGPYDTLQQAQHALKLYVAHL